MEIEELIESVAHDMLNPVNNIKIAFEYEKIGQTAAAVGFYSRAAEYGYYDYPELSYNALLRISYCVENQTGREHTLENCLLQAIDYLPNRPEAYLLISRFYERKGDWQEAYTFAGIGLKMANLNLEPLPISVDYAGPYTLKFQRMLSSWYIGRKDESINLLYDLAQTKDMDEQYKAPVINNFNNLGLDRSLLSDPISELKK